MKKIFKLVCVLTVFTAFTACDDYLDVNTDPNNPSASILTPDDVMAAAQSSTAATLNGRMNQLGNIMTTSWSANASDFASPFDSEFRYNVTSSFYTDIWTNLYVRTNNYTHIENFNDGQNWDNHRAVAKILKAYYFQYIVDLYGDVPYSEAHLGTANLFPKYDDDQEIYMNLVSLVEEAQALITNTDQNTVKPFGNSDITMDGDMGKWMRFSNTLKLRLLMRQATLAETDATVNTYITDKVAEMSANNALYLDEDATVNAGYFNAAGKQSPFFAGYGFDTEGDATSTHRMVGPSEYSFNILDGALPGTPTADPRINDLWKPRDANDNEFEGVLQGASTGRPAQLGAGIIKNSEQDLYLMLASESYFIQAEAAQRGYLTAGASAQQLFNAGVEASFVHLDPIQTADSEALAIIAAGNYLTASANDAKIGFNAGALEAIITQKWIALTSTNGIESWIEYTRTGFPAGIPLPETTSQTSRPNRLLYPETEYEGNSNNVIPQTSSNAFDTNVFWD